MDGRREQIAVAVGEACDPVDLVEAAGVVVALVVGDLGAAADFGASKR